MSHHFSKTVAMDFQAVADNVTAEPKACSFGIPAQIDVRQTLSTLIYAPWSHPSERRCSSRQVRPSGPSLRLRRAMDIVAHSLWASPGVIRTARRRSVGSGQARAAVTPAPPHCALHNKQIARHAWALLI